MPAIHEIRTIYKLGRLNETASMSPPEFGIMDFEHRCPTNQHRDKFRAELNSQPPVVESGRAVRVCGAAVQIHTA